MKWNIFMELWRSKIAEIYYYTSDLIEWENMEELLDYKMEQEEIKKFIKNNDFEGLNEYLLLLEKN